jgi:hypothetical protein
MAFLSRLELRRLLGTQSTLSVLACVVLLILVWRVIATVRQYLRLRHIKGPASAGFSNWWLIRALAGGRNHLDTYEACKKYGTF